MTSREEAILAVEKLLRYIESENKELREGVFDTPERVISSYDEIFSGYSEDPANVLDSTFNAEGFEGIVLLDGVEFHSTCEHHLQPFSGNAHIAYIPNKKIVGISKLARLLDIHAKRLQNQERITNSICNDIYEILSPNGCAVIIEAKHGCMRCRGVMKQNAIMKTSSMKGQFNDDSLIRDELFKLITHKK